MVIKKINKTLLEIRMTFITFAETLSRAFCDLHISLPVSASHDW